jgi:hypothetical protein
MKVEYLGNGSAPIWVGRVVETNAVLRFANSSSAPGRANFKQVLDIDACVWDVQRRLISCVTVAQWPAAERPDRKRKALV